LSICPLTPAFSSNHAPLMSARNGIKPSADENCVCGLPQHKARPFDVWIAKGLMVGQRNFSRSDEFF
jgi:hypothetical protein